MRIATLKLSVSAGKGIVLAVGDAGADQSFAGPPVTVAESLNAKLSKYEYSDAAERARVIRPYLQEFDPPGFGVWLRQWFTQTDDDAVLCVHAEDPRLSELPWSEILLPSFSPTGQGFVARVCELSGSPPRALTPPLRMLLAGWANLTGQEMPGVLRELRELPKKIGRAQLRIETLAEPTRRQFLDACQQQNLALLHLSPPSLIESKGLLAVPATAESAHRVSSRRRSTTNPGSAIEAISLGDLTKALKKNAELRMVVVNACLAGLRGCNQIARDLGVAAIGWPALVTDDIAADFTFYFYQRLLEGVSPLLAVRSFARTICTSQTAVDVPVVWLPSPEWVTWSPFGRAESAAQVAERAAAPKPRRQPAAAAPPQANPSTSERQPEAAPATPGAPPAAAAGPLPTLMPTAFMQGPRLEFRPRVAINPALLVNGLMPIEHLSIESPFEQEVHLRIDCDTGADISTFRQTVQLKQGVVPINTTDIHFPALHELVDRHAGRRRINFTATLTTLNGTELSGQTRTSLWMGGKEWLDEENTWAFVPAFVNPFDEGVLKVFDYAKKVLRTLGNPGDTFNGYQSEPAHVTTQMKAIFQTLRDDSIGITYISPAGSPVFDAVSKLRSGQVVRTHAEVVERKLGTCHDLALLLAACAEYVGIHPLIVLIPGHTFVGYWLTPEGQQEYWNQREGKLRTTKPGESWMITSREELCQLLEKKQIAFIEATWVCERDKTFDEACRYRAQQFMDDEDSFDVAIDVFAARREIQPLS